MKLFYFDPNRRVYEMNGVKKSGPFYEGYFRPIEVVSETDKEIICEYGVIKKKTMEYCLGRTRYKVYTETEKNDAVYVENNAYVLPKK